VSSNIPDLSGRRIGEYEIVARVGVGGMGAVYEGKQPLIGKRVAVKVLLPSLSGEAELVERFLSEARAVNEIRHRGIVDIFSFGQLEDGSHYFVMEFLQGEAFDRLIKKRAPMPLGEALMWIEETLDALDAAHSAGIIHRDIKPSNLFLVNTGRGKPYVKLLDFGIAKLGAIQGEATPQTRASVILGTPDYISPEQARGKPISPQTDLYAIGCVLFEMLTGERLFRGENTLQTMWMHVEDAPRAPSSVKPELPPELDDLILWCLEKESANRPPSAGELRDALAAIRLQYAPTGQFTPPPAGSGAQPVAHTPPPSGRNRALGGTPAPSGGMRPLGTPSPASRSGGQSSLSGRRPPVGPTAQHVPHAPDVTTPGVQPLGEGRPPETRLSPLTAMDAGALSSPSLRVDISEAEPGGTGSTEPEVDVVKPPRSPLPFVLAGLVVVVVLAVVAYVSIGAGQEAPKPVPVPVAVVVTPPPEDPKPVAVVATPEPTPTPTPTAVEPPKPPEPVAVVDPPKPTVEPKPPEPTPTAEPKPAVDPKPKAKGLTTEQLVARLRKIEAQLAAKEADTGEKDNVVRQFIDQARKDIQKATSDGDRREVWSFLGDIEAQLKR
jgi:serine/threonine-protein kinase